jgi:hypothetical protein
LIEPVHLLAECDDFLPEILVKLHLEPVTSLSVKQGTAGNGTAEHFFHAHGLSAEL